MGSSNTGAKDEPVSDGDDSNGDPSASDLGNFSEGEKVLAFHGPRIYQAKVQKVEFRKKEWRYYVHYLGWNKNWDEWVVVDRLMKFTEENVRKQQDLEKKLSADKSLKAGRSTQMKPKGSTDAKVDKEDLRNYVARGKKRKSDSGVEEKDTESMEKLVKIQIPSTLKKQLVDDWEFVTQLGELVKLPRSPCVDDILKKYLDYKSKKDGMVADSIGEILKGLRCYFDKALPVMLLYKKERQQYHEAVADNVSPSTVYGAEHLLRLFASYLNPTLQYQDARLGYDVEMLDALRRVINRMEPDTIRAAAAVDEIKIFREGSQGFADRLVIHSRDKTKPVKLPELLAYANIEEETQMRLQQKLLEFLKFMQKNQSTFFLSTYESSKGFEGSSGEQD